MMKFLLSLVVASVLLVACTTSPTGRSQLILFPEDQMSELGVAAFAQMKKQNPTLSGGSTDRYVECVANAIIRAMPQNNDPAQWEVEVFKDDSANAFALPGGKIGVHTGLLDVAKNQDQLAAVIGHEIAHVTAQHGNERMSNQFAAQTGLSLAAVVASQQEELRGQQQTIMALLGLGAQVGYLLPFSRSQEVESDKMGLELMAKAGFDPRQAVDLWRNMAQAGGGNQPPEFLSTHPGIDTRIEGLNQLAPKMMPLYEQAKAQGRRPNCR